MSRLFDDGAVDQAEYAGAAATAYPITMSAWIYPDAAIDGTVLSISRTAGLDRISLDVSAAGQLQAVVKSATQGPGVASSGSTFSLNEWVHITGVFTSNTLREVYYNGGNVQSNTTDVTPGSLDNTTIGHIHRQFGAGENPFSGRIEHAAIWPVALNANEILALARGAPPSTIRPLSLASGGYWPLWGIHSPEIDLTSNNRQMTLTGTARATGAPVVPYSRQFWNVTPAAPAVAAITFAHWGMMQGSVLWHPPFGYGIRPAMAGLGILFSVTGAPSAVVVANAPKRMLLGLGV